MHSKILTTGKQERHILPAAVNWHFWPWCNYACKFCFATFEDIPRGDRLSKEEALLIPEMLASAGAEKITFVGGEPTLCPYLGELIIAAKKVGLVTCIVSNGSGLTEQFLSEYSPYIDWIGLSIDASNDDLHEQIGRGLKKDLAIQRSHHLELSKDVWSRCQSYGIRMKLNTVVCSVNKDDTMLELVRQLRPDRWKIFEVLPVAGQNDEFIEGLVLKDGEFGAWLNRHKDVELDGIQFVPESNDLMRGSYAMLDALGRFYSNVDGRHQYASPILDVGVEKGWNENRFLEERFIERGGIYDW
jgi:radical S-adenosyl methionine domain-containing protein 2